MPTHCASGRLRTSVTLSVTAAVAFAALCAASHAQNIVATPNQDVIAEDQVREEMRALTETSTAPADVIQKATELYKQAIAELQQADSARGKADGYRAARSQDPKELDDLKAQLARTSAEPEAIPADTSLDDLKQKLAEAEAARAAAQREQADLEVESRYRSDRVDEVPVLDAAAKKRLDEVEKQLAELPDGDDKPDVGGRALRVLLLAKRTRIVAERSSYEEELPSYEATRELMRAKQDLAARHLKQSEKVERQLKDLVAERSRVDAEMKARDARWAVLTALPEVMPLAQENERLAELRNAPDGPAAKLEEVEREVAVLTAERNRVQTQFTHVRKLAELTDAVGLLLQQHRDELPDVSRHRANTRARQSEIAGVKLHLIELESKRSELADVESQAVQVASALNPTPPADKRKEVESAVRELLETRCEYLDALIADASRYFNALVMELDRSERELIRETNAYADFINERIFWIRSSPVLSLAEAPRVWKAVQWLGDADTCAGRGMRSSRTSATICCSTSF